MLCSDFSHDLSEGVPGIYKKATHVSGPQLDRQTQAHHPDDLYQRGLNGGSSRWGQGKLGDFPSTSRKLLHTIDLHTIHTPSIVSKVPCIRAQQIGYESPGCFRLRITLSVVAKDSDLSGWTTLQENVAIYYPEY